MRLQVDDVILDAATRQLWSGGREEHLSPKAFDLLLLLVERRPRAVTKAEIHEHLWPGTFVSDSSLPSLVLEIRDAIGDRERTPPLLRTLYGRGYAIRSDDTAPPAAGPNAGAQAVGWLVGDASEFALTDGENVLGREAGAGVILVKSSTVSRRHARIAVGPEGAIVEDLGSKNGTYVNDRRVEAPVPVVDGDRVRVGSLLFTFRRAQPAESTETVSSRDARRS